MWVSTTPQALHRRAPSSPGTYRQCGMKRRRRPKDTWVGNEERFPSGRRLGVRALTGERVAEGALTGRYLLVRASRQMAEGRPGASHPVRAGGGRGRRAAMGLHPSNSALEVQVTDGEPSTSSYRSRRASAFATQELVLERLRSRLASLTSRCPRSSTPGIGADGGMLPIPIWLDQPKSPARSSCFVTRAPRRAGRWGSSTA